MTYEFKYSTGDKVIDSITGYTGVITGCAIYIDGCVRYLVEPPMDDNGELHECWFDQGRIKLIKRNPEVPKKPTGGPTTNPVNPSKMKGTR